MSWVDTTKNFHKSILSRVGLSTTPNAIWGSVVAVTHALEDAAVEADEIACIGITNQRETAVVWDRASGEPIHNAIVWQCRRTADRCAEIIEAGYEDLIRARTSLVVDAYFAGTKAAWILDHVDGGRARAERGELAFGTIDSFLVWRLTNGARHVTDVSNASRTMLMDLNTMAWDDELLSIIGVPRETLPEIRPCSEVYGHTEGFRVYLVFLSPGWPVTNKQRSLGKLALKVGEAKCTYGTGAFLLMNTGQTPVTSQNGLLTTVAWQIGEDVTYALEGSAFIAGAAVQWLRDGLGIIDSAPDIEALALEVNDSGGVYFVPALTGLGTPYWRPDARGLISGITRGTTRAHLAELRSKASPSKTWIY